MIVATSVDVLERCGLVECSLCIDTVEEEAFDLIRGIQGVAVLVKHLLRELLEHATHIGAVGAAVLVDDFAEDKDLARSKDVRRRPVEGAPVDAETQIALALCREAADGRAV